MPWLGNGTFRRTDGTREGPTTWEQARDANRDINSPEHDTHDEDLADGIEACLAKNGENSPTADLPMAGRGHTGVRDAAAATEYASYGQLLNLVTPFVPDANVGGTATAITLAPTPAITAHRAGYGFRFFLQADFAGATTVAVSGLAPVALRRSDGAALGSGDGSTGRLVEMVYNGVVYVSTNVHPPPVDDSHEHNYLDIHELLTEELDSPAASDRLAASDESAAGEPAKWLSLSRLRTWIASTLTLAASRITSGTLDLGRIPSIDLARVPNLPASQTTSGEFAPERLGTSRPASDRDKSYLAADGQWRSLPVPFKGATILGIGGVTSGFNNNNVTTDISPNNPGDIQVGDRITYMASVNSAGSPAGSITVLFKGIEQTLDSEQLEVIQIGTSNFYLVFVRGRISAVDLTGVLTRLQIRIDLSGMQGNVHTFGVWWRE